MVFANKRKPSGSAVLCAVNRQDARGIPLLAGNVCANRRSRPCFTVPGPSVLQAGRIRVAQAWATSTAALGDGKVHVHDQVSSPCRRR